MQGFCRGRVGCFAQRRLVAGAGIRLRRTGVGDTIGCSGRAMTTVRVAATRVAAAIAGIFDKAQGASFESPGLCLESGQAQANQQQQGK